jgi:hypothetical protein
MFGSRWESVVDGKYEDRELFQQGFVWGIDGEQDFLFKLTIKNPNSNYNNDYFWIVKKRRERSPKEVIFNLVLMAGFILLL